MRFTVSLRSGGGCEHEHPDRWIGEGDDVEGGNEPGEFPDVGEVFERFHKITRDRNNQKLACASGQSAANSLTNPLFPASGPATRSSWAGIATRSPLNGLHPKSDFLAIRYWWGLALGSY